MGCRFPGAPDLRAFEEMLLAGRCSIGELPSERFNQAHYYDPDPNARGMSYSRIGACLDERPVDPRPCGLTAEELESADTVHLWALEVARATFEHAGIDPFSLEGRDVGVLMGHSRGGMRHSDMALGIGIEALLAGAGTLEALCELPASAQERLRAATVDRVRRAFPPVPRNRQPAFRASGTAGLVARAFGLRGRHLVVDAACASSLAAMDIAVRALQQGRLDLAIAGGAAFTSVHAMVLFSRSQALSAEGSFPFDARANGFIASDGVGMVLLARLEDAVAAGHRIYGVLHAVGASCDGRGKGLWAPNRKGQVLALRNAYASCDVDPASVGYVEAHGTSTALGDATEAEALTEFFGAHLPQGARIPIGSVKSNLGHCREAAGVAGLLKVLLAFDREVIPPSIGVLEPTPQVDWEKVPLLMAREPIPWKRGGAPRFAGIDSFGIGGLNYHVVVEEPPAAERLRELLGNGLAAPSSVRPDAPPENEPIAIVGIGCIVPGARGPSSFWQLLREGYVAIGDLPSSRWPAEIFHCEGGPGPYVTNSRKGGFITDFEPDWKRYRMPPALVRNIDPLQLMLLECALDAFGDAGIDLPKADRDRIGVTVGAMFGSDYALEIGLAVRAPEIAELFEQTARAEGVDAGVSRRAAAELVQKLRARLPVLNEDTSASASSSPLASRIASTLDLHGPVRAIDSAHASAIVALESACEALRAGTSDAIVWASGDRGLSWMRYVDAARTGILSDDGSCAPFEAESDGVALGEGAVACVLKRESDARAAGDRIYAVIRGIGSATGSDREGADSAPRVSAAQALSTAISDAHRLAGTTHERLAFVETLSTGDRRADGEALEAIRLLGTGQREHPLFVGSASANVGHAQGASGAIGLLKTALALHHGELPATPMRAPDPNLPAELQHCLRPLTLPRSDRPIQASVTALLPDATSYHVVLEEARRAEAVEVAAREPIVIRASSRRELERSLDDFALRPETLTPGSSHGHGSVAVGLRPGAGLEERIRIARKAIASLAASVALPAAGVALTDFTLPHHTCFLFPGQGSQYPGMLRDVAKGYPAAARRLEEIDALLVRGGQLPLSVVLWERTDVLNDVLWTQMSVLGGDLMMLEVARAHGLEPDVLTGHSYGDYPALVAAGSWTLEQVVEMTVVRCEHLLRAGRHGGMAAVFASRDVVAGLLHDLPGYAAQSNVNAPDEVIVSGEDEAVDALLERCQRAGVSARRLPVPMPFHSELMRPAAETVAGVIAGVAFQPPSVPFLTSSGARFLSEPDDLRRALVDQFTLPVDFIAQIEAAWAAGCRRFVEIGPGNLLSRLTSRILQGRPAVIAPLNDRKLSGIDAIEAALAMLRAHDAAEGRPLAPRQPVHSSAEGAPFAAAGEIRFFDVTTLRGGRRESPAPAPALVTAASRAGRNSAVEDRLVDLVCEHSGYPRDLIDLDADLEADLGIDTVKQAQILGRVRALYDLPADESMAIRDLPTLRRLAAWVESALGGAPATTPVPETATAEPVTSHPSPAISRDEESRPVHPVDLASLATSPAAALRYVLRTEVRERQTAGAGYRPERIVLLGGGEIAGSLLRAFASRGVRAEAVDLDWPGLEERLTTEPLPDLCLLSGVDRLARDPGGVDAFLSGWTDERSRLVRRPYLLLQRWIEQVRKPEARPATLSAITALGGALGLWNAVEGFPEGGAVLGLFRGLRREFPELRTKAVDVEPGCGADTAAQALLDELDSDDDAPEAGTLRGRRQVLSVHPVAARLDPVRLDELRALRSVVLTGGARGITAEIAMRLAGAGVRRLHLIGSTPVPPDVARWRGLDSEAMETLRLQVLRQLRAERGNVSPVEWDTACEPIEKAIEIDRNLGRIREAGAEVTYHAADVSDERQLAPVLDRIRAADGGIDAVVHGAGFQVSRGFLSKNATELDATLAPKIDGCVNLMRLTTDDPLRLFVAFGSVSGRFGGLGQADYSLASEMLARLVGGLAAARPACRALTISWPAWGEVGMAMHRRTRHMLETRGRAFMSVEEGCDHFLREVLSASAETEVTVGADIAALAALPEPSDGLRVRNEPAPALPLADGVLSAHDGDTVVECHLDADRDPFLVQHRQGRTGIAPAVVLLEFLAETARLAQRDGEAPSLLEDVAIETGVRLGDARRLTIRGRGVVRGDDTDLEVSAHQTGGRGRLLSLDRRRLAARARYGRTGPPARPIGWMPMPSAWRPADYDRHAATEQGPAEWFHGPDLRTLERVTMLVGPLHWGIVRARPASNLGRWAGVGWCVPAPALDGCLSLCVGVIRDKLGTDGLPSAFGRLWLLRAPLPDEECTVIARELGHEERIVRFDFTLFGADHAPILVAEDYQVRTFGSIESSANDPMPSAEQRA